MTNLHVVYRVDEPGKPGEQWSAYSFPHGIYTGGSILAEVRSEVHEIIESMEDLRDSVLLEHIENPVRHVQGAYIRVAVDRHSLDRDVARDQMLGSLMVRAQREDFTRNAALAASGDAIIVACVADDPLSWLFEQMTDHDSLGLCMAGPITEAGSVIWSSFVIGQFGHRSEQDAMESLADAGLGLDSTVADFMRVTLKAPRQLLIGAR